MKESPSSPQNGLGSRNQIRSSIGSPLNYRRKRKGLGSRAEMAIDHGLSASRVVRNALRDRSCF